MAMAAQEKEEEDDNGEGEGKTEKIRPWIPAFLTHILHFCQEEGVYKRYFWASASSEICAPGGLYFAYSVFLGVTLAWLMQSPESLFFDLQQLY
jgi:hypothetical protein